MQIGSFIMSKDGGWHGVIRTLTFHARVRLVPNDDRAGDKAPVFRVLLGNVRIGDAWEARTKGNNPKPYLRLRLDDPTLPEALIAALFPLEDSDKARLLWNRR